ncbi:hypothetical protein [Sphingosinicella sp. BN140058]|uniref:hypothetical protein n=1 Tax=Sphingosinicella sp. BN140058 TaxID=1892855 RepID=UPI001010359A|nr:hypothetical protein [Sphingosinicella sp. BN140058]QAY78897.1 hypothetical protein ETR14_21915 [Sphingosinicella sp. BN140058]
MREGAARRSFRLKVEALEQAVKEGIVPKELPKILKLDDVRCWNAPPMSSWSSFSVAAPGALNSDLRERLDRVLPSFVKLQSGKVKRGPKPPRTMSVGDWLIREERNALLQQNAQLLGRVQEAESQVRSMRTIIASQKKKIGELSASLRKVVPLRETV